MSADAGLFTATNYYAAQLDEGQRYQDFVAHELLREGIVLVNYSTQRGQIEYGENALGLEIKYDMKFATTGNFWIETQERRQAAGQWVKSGVFRDDNSWLYGLGNYEEFFIFSKRTLRLLAPQRPIRDNNLQTSRGFLLSRAEAAELVEKAVIFPDKRF